MLDSSQIQEALQRYNSYHRDEWEKAYFDEISGGFNVYHKEHQFAKIGGGGEAEKVVGKMLATNGKQVEFLPENGRGMKKPDLAFNEQTWDVKFIDKANVGTIRDAIKDVQKAHNAIFYWSIGKDRLGDLQNAITRELGNFMKNKRIEKFPDIYYMDNRNGALKLLWKKQKEAE
ncbi:MAG: hypothetical protein LBT94_03120 [Prevotellaceae bacterium]|nr:hypothetical protein [Prevotellaceae bacterium]